MHKILLDNIVNRKVTCGQRKTRFMVSSPKRGSSWEQADWTPKSTIRHKQADTQLNVLLSYRGDPSIWHVIYECPCSWVEANVSETDCSLSQPVSEYVKMAFEVEHTTLCDVMPNFPLEYESLGPIESPYWVNPTLKDHNALHNTRTDVVLRANVWKMYHPARWAQKHSTPLSHQFTLIHSTYTPNPLGIA